MFFRGIKFRLVSLFVLFFGTTLILFSFFLYNSFEKNQQVEFDASLYNYTVDVVSAIKVNLFGDAFLDPDFFKNQDKLFPFSLGKTYILFRSKDGKILVRSQNSTALEFPFTNATANNVFLFGKYFETLNFKPDTTIYRMISQKIDAPNGQSFIIQIAAPMDLLERQRKGLVTFFGVSVPVVLLISTLMGWVFMRRVLAPVTDIITKAKQISVGNLSERIPLSGTHDEIHRLTESLNDLLNRLEKAFKSQERFIADASHQLKTPLAILKGELDLIRNHETKKEDVAAFLKSATEEVSSLSQIVQNLLLLARVDAGVEKFNFHQVRVEEILLGLIPRLEKLANKKEIKININVADTPESSFEIFGDEELLNCLVGNLVENAIKYSDFKTVVNIKLEQQGNNIMVHVKDMGPGVLPEEQEKIFDRFYRSMKSKQKIEGAGLGLALSRKIAQILGGKLYMQNNQNGPGSIFTFEIKKN